MNKRLKGVASIISAFTIAFAPLPQTSLRYFSGSTVKAEETRASNELQDLISSLINEHNSNYDYMKDSTYIELASKLGISLLTQYSENLDRRLSKHFNIGNLDGDNIPEIVVYEQRNFQDLDDEGALVLYKYKDCKYREVHRISMNYDNTVEDIVIGQGSKGKNAVFVNSHVGAHSEQFYLFTMEDDKLNSKISRKKARLLSVYSNSQIKDIDKDGILEFCIYDIDPESSSSSCADSDKINIWYKWDGKDGVKFIKYEKVGEFKKVKTDATVISNYNNLINKGQLSKAYSYLKANKYKLSIKDNTDAVKAYLSALNKRLSSINADFSKYQEKYKMFENQGIMKMYKLKYADLNNINIVKNTFVFSKEKDLKDMLLNANSMGLKVATAEGSYYFVIDYQKFLEFSPLVSSEMEDYFNIFAAESNKPALSEEYVKIPLDEIALRIARMEEFKLNYPYSKYLPEINEMHQWYLRGYIFSTYDFTSHKVSAETLKSYEKSMKDYDYLVLHDILKTYTEGLNESGNIVTQDLIDKMNQVISDI